MVRVVTTGDMVDPLVDLVAIHRRREKLRLPAAAETPPPINRSPEKKTDTRYRPMRRLYVENVPASASEKAVMEFLNNIFLSLGANYVLGSLRCISCNIQEEKGQALVEFLTPEDASAARCL
ncbi:hypothetical protein EZV62_026069 [Acer yangbiense]|uniref:RRM domain-containing protein n=1 Tax=Acer yangbiense TaxID=1000413 RepID=A0A5C7GQF7_9ROSI|nr:hypothetical protein EZV62_026069 [Acer yangbiense]